LPERWAFADEIPRTSVGKYDKKAIRSRYAEHGYWVIEVHN
jgi:fatty-acyl-CoA synthase